MSMRATSALPCRKAQCNGVKPALSWIPTSVVFDKQARELHSSLERGPMQRSQPILVLYCDAGVVLDEETGNFYMTFP